MNATRTFVALALIGSILIYSLVFCFGAEALLEKWFLPTASGPERAHAVNETFTNGTPMLVVVAVLGTNYTRVSSISIPGPQPRNVSGFSYRFGEQEIMVATTAATNSDPVSGAFICAAYVRPGTNRFYRNYIYIGQDAAANGSQPSRSETNRASETAGSPR